MRTQIIIFSLMVVLMACGKSEDINMPPDQPTLLSPTDGTSCESLKPSFTWEATDPEKDNLTYTIWLGTDKTNLSIEKEDLQNPRYIPSSDLLMATMYHWQIEAHDGTSSTLSEIMSFSTTGEGENGDLPSRPVLIAPINDVSAGNITFSWEASSKGEGSIVYDLYIKHGNDSDFTLLESGLSNTSHSASLTTGTLSWYVQAKDSRGQLAQSAIISLSLN